MLGPYELNQIYTGDSRLLAESIPDNSIDLIFTDPVYSQIEDYEWLAKTAARVLKDDRACLVFHGIEWTGETINALTKGGLTYRWQFGTLLTGGQSARFMPKGFAKWYSCLWVEKGLSSPYGHIVDAQISKFSQQNSFHCWSKSPDVLGHWLEAFTQPGAIVFDPFTGGGTVPAVCKMLCRDYLAFEIDPATADKARERVFSTQPPLFVPAPVQSGLWAEP